jgi:hypothetical protein
MGHLCAITSELDLFVIGPVADRLALFIYFASDNAMILLGSIIIVDFVPT